MIKQDALKDAPSLQRDFNLQMNLLTLNEPLTAIKKNQRKINTPTYKHKVTSLYNTYNQNYIISQKKIADIESKDTYWHLQFSLQILNTVIFALCE